VSDFTDVATWQGSAYAAFVIDGFARRTVGWRRLSRTAHAGFVPNALEQASHDRCPSNDREGVQYLSIRYTDRILKADCCPDQRCSG
jgi:putative transposase